MVSIKNFFLKVIFYLKILLYVSLFLTLTYSYYVINNNKTLEQTFAKVSEKNNVNYKTIMAICKGESNFTKNVVNVNKSIFNFQQGAHYFDSWFTANLYMDLILDPLFLNYDVGMCQINKIHLKKNKIDNEHLLNNEKNIEMSSKIYSYNLKACKGNEMCALSMYNTGRSHTKSKIGTRYAKKILAIRKKMFGF